MNRQTNLIRSIVLVLTLYVVMLITLDKKNKFDNLNTESQDKFNTVVLIDSLFALERAIWIHIDISTSDPALLKFREETKNAKSYYDIMIVINGKEYAMSLDEFISRLDKR